MNNLLSYCGLVVARIRASEKDLPVQFVVTYFAGLVFMNLFEIVVSVLFVVNL